jgi:glycosyl transferase family 25
MKAFVVYLSGNDFSVNMTAETIESLEKFNIDYELFDGVVGRAGIKVLDSFGVRPSATVKRDQWTDGTIGCLASHYLLWDKCAGQNEPFLVLEQDGVLIRDPREIVPLVEKACHLDAYLPFQSGNDAHFEIYNENLTKYEPGVKKHPKNSFYIGNEVTGESFRGTYGYLITPSGAKDILRFVEKYGAFPSDKCMCSKATYIQRANSSYVRLNKFFSTLKIQKDYSLR